MTMTLGERLRVTLFGESHGSAVGALLEGVPAGLAIDETEIAADLARRRPGRRGLSARDESDVVEVVSGVHAGVATGWPLLLLCRNTDAQSSDYDFLPDHPRPGHADLPEAVRSGGAADERGGGSNSGRLTLGLVAAGAIMRGIMQRAGMQAVAHCASIGEVRARPLLEFVDSSTSTDATEAEREARIRLNCLDGEAAERFVAAIDESRRRKDSLGSTVEALLSGAPLGLGSPWFDGVEPALARGLMAIPGARAVEFGRGVAASVMRGSEHNDVWSQSPEGEPVLASGADGALGGLATGAPLRIIVHFKPPSSIATPQDTLHLPSGEQRPLVVRGRHDPVLAPRAAPVVEAVVRLVICDLWLRRHRAMEEV